MPMVEVSTVWTVYSPRDLYQPLNSSSLSRSRRPQARFHCVACGHNANAALNAAANILASRTDTSPCGNAGLHKEVAAAETRDGLGSVKPIRCRPDITFVHNFQSDGDARTLWG